VNRLALALLVVLAGCADERVLSAPCDGGGCTADVHLPGILDPASPNFHATILKNENWSFPLCATCHGQDFSGGTSGVSCLGCHTAGPTACVTCHGSGPTSNAHGAHASTTLTSITCVECHIVPTSWDDDGHIIHNGVAITAPATVTFGARAAITIDPANRLGPPAWDGATCSNVYCHGDVLGTPGGGTITEPRWDDPTPDGTCNRCHGDPPPSHARTDCASCHPASAPHIDGIVQIGRVPGCSGCHGSPSSPAPPVDLEGNTFTTAIGVGAHQAHLQALSKISAPIPCATCHVVPATLESPGHIDSPGPAIVTASLGWNRVAQTCSSAWCHEVGRPVWTSSGEVFCGSCHGIPPVDASHNAGMTLTSCASCHPGTVDAFGNIIVTNGTSEHINGIVDLQ
jgi:predicted CxxxxCH...CXXCH cytochrome family protein